MNTGKETLGTLEMAVAMVISGSIGLFVVKSGQSPENIVFFRCVIAFLCLIPVCVLSGSFQREYFQPKNLAMMIVSGWLLIFNWVLLFKAFPLTSISLATIVYHVNPFIILLLGVVVLKERFTASDGAWIALGFAGLLVVIGLDEVNVPRMELAGLGLVLVATSLYSGSVLIAKKLAGTPPLLIVLVQAFAGAVTTYPLTSSPGEGVSFHQWPFIVALGAVHTAFLYWLIYSAIARLRLSIVAILSFLYPISTVAFDYFFFGHLISPRQAVGACLILMATAGAKLHWRVRLPVRRT
ncbi:MAG: DMT family transporter [Xenophilus sp.]